MLHLEKNFANKFKLCNTKNIFVLPPILKKIGAFWQVCFFVVSSYKNCDVKRPIGLICVNKKGKINTFDFESYDFCEEFDFNKTYYNFKNSDYLPNTTSKNEELLRIILQDLYKIFSKKNLFKGINKNEYKRYLINLKKFFPEEFFEFYNLLQNNKITMIDKKTKLLRENFFNIFKKQEELAIIESNKRSIINKKEFVNKTEKQLKKYLREEVMPSFKNAGSFCKILFFDKVGNFIKNLNYDNCKDCFDINLQKETLQKNKEDFLNNLKVEIIKIYSKAIENKFAKNNSVDTLSKILIVFLNSLLIEEKNKNCIKNFEEEIAESKQIFEENIINIKIEEAKDVLQSFYKDLCDDYLQTNKKNFSNLFLAYLFIFG